MSIIGIKTTSNLTGYPAGGAGKSTSGGNFSSRMDSITDTRKEAWDSLENESGAKTADARTILDAYLMSSACGTHETVFSDKSIGGADDMKRSRV